MNIVAECFSIICIYFQVFKCNTATAGFRTLLILDGSKDGEYGWHIDQKS